MWKHLGYIEIYVHSNISLVHACKKTWNYKCICIYIVNCALHLLLKHELFSIPFIMQSNFKKCGILFLIFHLENCVHDLLLPRSTEKGLWYYPSQWKLVTRTVFFQSFSSLHFMTVYQKKGRLWAHYFDFHHCSSVDEIYFCFKTILFVKLLRKESWNIGIQSTNETCLIIIYIINMKLAIKWSLMKCIN